VERVAAVSVPPQGGGGPSALGIVRAERVGAEEAPYQKRRRIRRGAVSESERGKLFDPLSNALGQGGGVKFRFAAWELDLDRRELRHEGDSVAVEPQVFDVLSYLVVNHERFVSKEELLDNIWGDRFVSESALTSRIKSARRAVGDSGQSQHVIRTVHGRGYRFVAALSTADPATASERPRLVPAAASPAAGDEWQLPTDAVGRTWPLLGRTREVELISAAFRDGKTGGVLLTGPAGVGKTRLALECVRLAQQAGVMVARVSGHPETKPLPFGAAAHVLPAEVVAATGPEGELDRATVFHRARAAVERATQGKRAMVMLDDVDQLDDLTRALMVSLVQARAIFAVATLRTDSSDDGVERLVKDHHLRPLPISALAPDVIETLLTRVVGGPLEPTTVAWLRDTSTGNPGLLRQLLEHARDTGNLVERNGVWSLDWMLARPAPSLELVIQERLAELNDDERQAVELLALAGALDLMVLTSLVDDEVLERLEHRGLLHVTDADRRTEVSLTHPLFVDVLRAELPTMRGRRLRRMLADAVTAHGAERRSDQVRVVAWRLEAGGAVDGRLLAHAARLALIDGDNVMAERILDRAEAVDRTPEVVQLMAELEFRRGHTNAVESLLASIDTDELDDQTRAQVLRRRATNLFYQRGQFLEGVQLLTHGLDELSDPDAREALEAYHVLLLAMGGFVGEALVRSEPLLARMTGAPRLELLRGRSLALAVAGRADDALDVIGEGLHIYDSLAAELDRPGRSTLLFTQVLALGELGRVQEATAISRHALEGRPASVTRSWIALSEARSNLAIGEPAVIRRGLDSLVRSSRSLGHGATERWALALVASARLLEGDVAGASEDLARVASLEVGPRGLFHADIDRAHAWLAATVDRPQVACERLLVAAADAASFSKYALEATLLHDVVRLGGAASVVTRLSELAACSQGRYARARAAHARGVAAGDHDALAEAVDIFEDCGLTLLAAEAAAQVALLSPDGADRAAKLRDSLPPGITTPLLEAPSLMC
jgi:DNA-binding winged helix-turn-helix (wHTH) protein